MPITKVGMNAVFTLEVGKHTESEIGSRGHRKLRPEKGPPEKCRFAEIP